MEIYISAEFLFLQASEIYIGFEYYYLNITSFLPSIKIECRKENVEPEIGGEIYFDSSHM